jgi:UDPglucose 6-dehydrogenase
LLVTEWEDFRKVDLARLKTCMAQSVLFDGRNVFDPKRVREAGFTYFSVGRA